MLKLKRRSYHTDGGEGDLFPSMSCSPEEPSSPVSCPQRTIQFLEPPKRARIAHECSPSRVQTSGSRPSLLKKPNPYKIGSGSVVRKCIDKKMQHNIRTRNQNCVFTIDDVELIIKYALDEREKELHEHYDSNLRELLQQQFDQFSRFNQDYVSNKMKESDHSYFS